MNVIDHAILIPASPEFIWRFLGDISHNSKWQEDCADISFLTTQHEGRGTRWRYATPKGKDVIVEVSAWYDTLGYEYRIVEGTSVSENQGRIRLQEIAEGTLVQWTFNYELDGMLGGLRNSIGIKRSLTNNIQDSLRNLYKLVQQETGGISTHEARSAMKDAPDVEERGNYQPRHPSNFKEEPSSDTYDEPTYPSESSISYEINREKIVEPPIADDDTKPNPVVQGTDEVEPVDMSNPILINQLQEPPIVDDDTKPNAPIEAIEPIDSTEAEFSEPPVEEILPSADDQPTPAPNTGDIRDTSRISVFEIFGLQKPSETQEVAALSDADIVEMVNAEDSKRETLEAQVIHVDDPAEPIVEDTPIEEDPPEEPDVADIPAVVVPEILEDNPTVTIPTTPKSITGLRLVLRRKMINLQRR